MIKVDKVDFYDVEPDHGKCKSHPIITLQCTATAWAGYSLFERFNIRLFSALFPAVLQVIIKQTNMLDFEEIDHDAQRT
jgi:hypothetical protein